MTGKHLESRRFWNKTRTEKNAHLILDHEINFHLTIKDLRVWPSLSGPWDLI